MTVKSKARQARRSSKHESTAPAARPTTHVPAKPEEKRAAGEIMRALLNAITFGALEARPSRATRVS